jgi:hypothetical protein
MLGALLDSTLGGILYTEISSAGRGLQVTRSCLAGGDEIWELRS